MVKIGVILFMLSILASCSGTRRLAEDEHALHRNSFNIITDDNRVTVNRIREDLRKAVKQEPVRKNILNPRTYGKPLTVFDRVLTLESIDAFEKILRNREGFYEAKVDYEKVPQDDSGKKVEVVYTVDLGPRMYVRSFKHNFEDSAMQTIMSQYDLGIEVVAGEPLEASSFEAEKVRMVQVLKNEGYADFNANYIDIVGDSIGYEVDATMYVHNPPGQDAHTRFRIGDINVYTEHNRSTQPQIERVETLQEKNYFSKSNQFLVKPKSIDDIIPISRGELFNKSRETKMNLNLSRLAPYRFAVVDSYVDSDSSDIYNYNVYLSPFQNKWVVNSGINFFYSSINTMNNQNLFGFSGNLAFTNRNFKNRAIRHTISAEGTLEYNFPDFPDLSGPITNTQSIQLSNTFDIPKVVDVFKISNFLNRVGLVSDENLENINANGTTTVDFSGGITSIFNFYELRNFDASWTFNFQPNPRLKYTVKQIGINLIDTDIQEIFQEEILVDNPLLARSFDPYLITGFFFREFSLFKQLKESARGDKLFFIGNFELSGLENILLNRIVNGVSSFDEDWQLGNLEFSEFIRLEGDLRYTKQVKERSSFAARINAGLIVPYAGDDAVPFIKQFYSGGPNSIRGWQLRELGPGSFQEQRLDNTAFFQSGDIKLEFNLEYRFDLFWYFEGAVFLDGGNVWTLDDDPSRPGAQFSSGFLDQVALSSGWGLRLDFDYFIFRFDFGYKLRNPFPNPETGSHFVLTDGDFNTRIGNVNFAINYPF